MLFTIDASQHLIIVYRLKNDGQWRQIEYGTHEYYEDDMIFETFEQANSWLEGHDTVVINNTRVETRPESVTLGGDHYHFAVIVHRITRPQHLFTKREMMDAILNGDNSKTNCLVVDLNGYVRLVALTDRTPLSLRGYAVRFESFSPYTDYVGSNIDLADTTDYDEIYKALLEGWLSHLRTGEMRYMNTFPTESEDDLIDLINEEVNRI